MSSTQVEANCLAEAEVEGESEATDNEVDSVFSSECNAWTEETDEIDNELSTMTFEELMKLKEELGSKVYKEAVFGAPKYKTPYKSPNSSKRLNKNRPREMSSKKQVPFFAGFEFLESNSPIPCDPRFDDKSGTYDPKKFKENYKFLIYVRQKEIAEIKKRMASAKEQKKRKNLSFVMLRMNNMNVEEKNWHAKQAMLKQEQKEIQKAKMEGRKPHYVTKKERRAKELVRKFTELKSKGKLDKHLEKRRKKNAAKDRKKIQIDV